MFDLLLLCAASATGSIPCAAPVSDEPQITFTEPVRLRAGDGFVRTEPPGYAAPALHDVDGDGRRDLVVGQFAGGKLKVYPGRADGTFADGEWLMAGGEVAEVPGVW